MQKCRVKPNNFAISTKDLSDGIRKAASTAKTFGVDLQELTGYIAAIGSTTRESGAIVGNGLKTILSRITTIEGAETTLNSVNVAMRDMEGNVKPVSDILTDLAGNWSSLSAEQQQNIGVTLAGRYQLSRFYALMNNFSIAQDATTTALNSTGSAMREQEKYADSLEARINRLDTAWNKLTLSTGNAFLTDGLIAGIETLNDLASVTSVVVDKFGVLSGVFGTVGMATVLLSTRVRTMATALIFGTSSLSGTAMAATGLSAGMTRASVATVTLTTAMRGLAAATIVGAAFVAIGFAVEKLISAYSNAKQKQEEFEASQQKNVEALTVNKQKTEELIESYKKLSAERSNGDWDTSKEKEYLNIQQQLGDLYPNLIASTDANGQYHLLSVDAINKEIEATQELIDLKKEETRLNAQKTFNENIDELDGFFGLEKQIERKKKQLADFQKGTTDGAKVLVNQTKQEILALEQELYSASAKINDTVLKVADSYNKLKIDSSIQQSVTNFISSLDLTNLNSSELESYAIRVANLTDAMQKAYDSGDSEAFNSAKQSLADYAKQFGATEVQADSLGVSLDDVARKNEQLANSTYAGRDGTDALADSELGLANSANSASGAIDGETGAISGNTSAKWDNISATEMLFGITSDQLSQAQKAIQIVQLLSTVEKLNANQKALLSQATSFLSKMYPELSGAIAENIGYIQGEIEVMNILNGASGQNADVLMQNQISATDTTISAVNNRIAAYRKEIDALLAVAQAQSAAADMNGEGTLQVPSGLQSASQALNNLIATRENLLARQAAYGNYIDGNLSTIGSPSTGGSGSGGSGGSSDADRAAEQAAKDKEQFLDDVTDLYKEAYETQKEIALDAIEKERQAFESAHETKMDALEDQLDKYTEIVNSMKEAIDLQEEERDYDNNLSEKQEERQKIQDQINKLSLDSTKQAEVANLKEQLIEMDKEIAEFQHDRQVDLQKQNLDNLLESKQKEVEKAKELEESNYNTGIALFDSRKSSTERQYDNLINDQRALADVQNKIVNGSTSTVLSQLSNFINSVSANKSIIGESVAQNLIDVLNEAKGKISSRNFTPLQQFDTGGKTVGEGLAYLHDKEIVLNQNDSTNIMKAVDSARSFADMIKNFRIDSILKEGIPNLLKIVQPTIPTLSPSTHVNRPTYSLNIENISVTGDQKGADTVWQTIYKNFKTLG